jgi:hypothetical protein
MSDCEGTVIRFGTSSMDHTSRQTTAMSLHALCMHAVLHGLRVCRIPEAYIAPLPESTAAPLRALISHYGIRLVVHAPICAPYRLEAWFATVIEFFAILDAADAVIVCHLPVLSCADRAMFARLPDWVARHLAIELTHQRTATLLSDIDPYAIPVVFDSLHYDMQLPWPYEPINALFACMDSWGTRIPLVHLSSQATAVRGARHVPARGTHSDVLDPTHAVLFVRSILEADRHADIELEADAGVLAYGHIHEVLKRVVPPEHRGAFHRHGGGSDAPYPIR